MLMEVTPEEYIRCLLYTSSNVDITYASNQGAVWSGGLIGQYRAGTIQECAYTCEISAMDNTGQAGAGGNCGALHGGKMCIRDSR